MNLTSTRHVIIAVEQIEMLERACRAVLKQNDLSADAREEFEMLEGMLEDTRTNGDEDTINDFTG